MHDLNIHMLLDGIRTAEAYERDMTERLCAPDASTDVGPGERLALCFLKSAAHDTARKFVEELARRVDTPLSGIARAAFALQRARLGHTGPGVDECDAELARLLAEAGFK